MIVRLLVATSMCALLFFFVSCNSAFPRENKWSTKDYPNFRVKFVDSKTGFILGPRILRTTDGGKSWSVIEYAREAGAIIARDGPETRKFAVDFVDQDFGWRLSSRDMNAVDYTEDGGHSWSQPMRFGDKVYQRSLIFLNRETGWVCGESSVMKTTDGGKHWSEEVSLRGLRLQYPFFLDQSHGWIANEFGDLAQTVDGGQHWTIEKSLPRKVTTIFFTTDMVGWLVGEDGTVARTEDGGQNWFRENVPVPYDASRKEHVKLLDIFFQTKEVGWITGYDGLLLRTVDGGRTWTNIETPTKAPLSSIRFVDDQRGWAVGGFWVPAIPVAAPSNVVIETIDGGKTWRIKTFS